MTDRTRPPLLLNRAATKRFILERIKATRPHWLCDRVSGEAYDFYEGFIGQEIRRMVHDPAKAGVSADELPGQSLLVRGTVRTRLLGGLHEAVRWARIVKIDQIALDSIEEDLRQRILADIRNHPTGCKTFKP